MKVFKTVHGEALLEPEIVPPYKRDPEATVALMFARFIAGPYAREVSRCYRCSQYFVNTSGHRNKIYCDRKCAVKATVKHSRELAQAEKLERLRKAYSKFRRFRPEVSNWKEWVTQEAGVHQRWLTRAINSGKSPPNPLGRSKILV